MVKRAVETGSPLAFLVVRGRSAPWWNVVVQVVEEGLRVWRLSGKMIICLARTYPIGWVEVEAEKYSMGLTNL